jgi:hypothetical protein
MPEPGNQTGLKLRREHSRKEQFCRSAIEQFRRMQTTAALATLLNKQDRGFRVYADFQDCDCRLRRCGTRKAEAAS